jgi:hypothetical protein
MPDTPSDAPVPNRPQPGALPGLGDLGGLLESAQEAFSAQARAADEVVTGSAGGGVVTVEMSGAGEVRSVTLAPEVVDPEDVRWAGSTSTGSVVRSAASSAIRAGVPAPKRVSRPPWPYMPVRSRT